MTPTDEDVAGDRREQKQEHKREGQGEERRDGHPAKHPVLVANLVDQQA